MRTYVYNDMWEHLVAYGMERGAANSGRLIRSALGSQDHGVSESIELCSRRAYDVVSS